MLPNITKDMKTKLALYATHDWDITDKWNVYYGARFEYQRLAGKNLAVYNAEGQSGRAALPVIISGQLQPMVRR